MHEMSIAINIVEIAEEEVQKAGARSVLSIKLEIGALSGVIIEALEFAMEEAVKNTILENAKVDILFIPAKARCMNCHNEFEVDDLFSPCPECNSIETEIIKGREMKIKSLVVD